jgi:hypothetical protein
VTVERSYVRNERYIERFQTELVQSERVEPLHARNGVRHAVSMTPLKRTLFVIFSRISRLAFSGRVSIAKFSAIRRMEESYADAAKPLRH